MRSYLVPMSNSKASIVAAKLACVKAKNHGGRVELLHVIAPPDEETPFNISEIMREEQAMEAKRFLHAIEAELFAFTGLKPVLKITEGNVADAIINNINANTILIVLGRDQESGTGELLEWLVSNLGKKLEVPLMIVPGELSDQQLQLLA